MANKISESESQYNPKKKHHHVSKSQCGMNSDKLMVYKNFANISNQNYESYDEDKNSTHKVNITTEGLEFVENSKIDKNSQVDDNYKKDNMKDFFLQQKCERGKNNYHQLMRLANNRSAQKGYLGVHVNRAKNAISEFMARKFSGGTLISKHNEANINNTVIEIDQGSVNKSDDKCNDGISKNFTDRVNNSRSLTNKIALTDVLRPKLTKFINFQPKIGSLPVLKPKKFRNQSFGEIGNKSIELPEIDQTFQNSYIGDNNFSPAKEKRVESSQVKSFIDDSTFNLFASQNNKKPQKQISISLFRKDKLKSEHNIDEIQNNLLGGLSKELGSLSKETYIKDSGLGDKNNIQQNVFGGFLHKEPEGQKRVEDHPDYSKKVENEILLESRYKELQDKSESKYLKTKISNAIDVQDQYKKKMGKNESLHDTFKWILKNDKQLLKDTGLDSKYSAMQLLNKSDFEINKYYDITDVEQHIETNFKKIQNMEAKLQRLVDQENHDREIQVKSQKKPAYYFNGPRERGKSHELNLSGKEAAGELMQENMKASEFEEKIKSEMNLITKVESEKRFSAFTEFKHRRYQDNWENKFKVHKQERARKSNKTSVYLGKLLEPMTAQVAAYRAIITLGPNEPLKRKSILLKNPLADSIVDSNNTSKFNFTKKNSIKSGMVSNTNLFPAKKVER